jgi:hypothetical protein
VALADVQSIWRGERRFGPLDIWKQLFIGEQVPDRSNTFALFHTEHTQEAKAAFELKDEIVTRSE